MIIYRFERNGIGPYVGGVPLNVTTHWVGVENKRASKKANAAREKFLSQIKHIDLWTKAHQNQTMLFGCPSKETLRAFFGYRFKPLFAAGYRIKKINVPDDEVINMGIECAFPVKYHKFRTKKNMRKAVDAIYQSRWKK